MRRLSGLFLLCLGLAAALGGAERRVITPAGSAKPVGPYSPGIDAGAYLYVSGQGARDSAGRMPATFEEQTRLAIDNVKQIVEGAGLTLAHIVYAQVYLTDMSQYATMDRLWNESFPKAPPARAVLGVQRMPVDTPVEINAVAVRDLSRKKNIAHGAVLTHDRLYIPGCFGLDRASGKVPGDPAAEVQAALDGMKRVLESAGLDFRHVVFVNPYLTRDMPTDVMNRAYAGRFEFGNTPARATIEVASLPLGARIEFTGVAVRNLALRRAVRPKNMPPSPTASPCVFAVDTLFCSAKSAFIPGPNSGIFVAGVADQVRMSMRNLLDGLEEAGMDFSNVVSTNVYLDNISDFAEMNGIYGLYFKGAPPTRTTVQPKASVERKRDAQGRAPKLEEVSLVAVK